MFVKKEQWDALMRRIDRMEERMSAVNTAAEQEGQITRLQGALRRMESRLIPADGVQFLAAVREGLDRIQMTMKRVKEMMDEWDRKIDAERAGIPEITGVEKPPGNGGFPTG